MRWKKILVIFGVIVIGLVGASLILIFSYDYNKFKPYISQAAREATGRELTLEGDLKLKIGFTPALVVENIQFQNAPWGSRPEMARVKRFELEVALFPLLSRNIQINRFRLVEPHILVEINRDGKSNLALERKTEGKLPDKKKDEKIPLPAFLIRELLIEKGAVIYRDSRSGKTYALSLDSFSITMDADKPIEMKGKGAYNKAPFNIAAKFGSIEAFINPAKEWPLNLHLETSETTLSVDGTIQDPLAARGFRLNLRMKSGDIAKLSPLLGAPIPVKGPLEISAQVSDPTPQVYKISNLKILMGKSDLQGGGEISIKEPRPYLTGDFSSRLLDAKSLIPQKPIAGDTVPKASKPSQKGQRIFPNDPLPFDALKTVDADVKVSADRIVFPHLLLEKLRVAAHLKDGALILKPFQAVIGGGTLDGSINLRAEGKEANFVNSIKIDRFDVGMLLKELGGTDLFEGKVDMILNLQGKGNSIASLMAALSGNTQITMSKGRIAQKYVDLLGPGVTGNLLRILNPLKKSSEVELNCFVNAFDIQNGLARSRALVLDTSLLTVVGEGTVNLKAEELDLSFKPFTKDTLGIKWADLGLGDLSTPLKLTGTLGNPSLGISKTKTTLALSTLLGSGLAGLPGTALKGGREEPNYCLAALEAIQKGGKAPPPKKEKGTAEEATDTLRKILGK